MRFPKLVEVTILIAVMASVSACVPAQVDQPSPTSPVIVNLPVVKLPDVTIQSATPIPSPTFRPQATCTRCPAKPATETPLPSASPTPNIERIVKGEKLDVWDDPANEDSYWHRVTQLITGERVTAVTKSQDGEWTKIFAIDQPYKDSGFGYPGWVRTAGLLSAPQIADAYAVVMVRSTFILAMPQPNAMRLMRLYLDTRLPVLSTVEGWVESSLPDGHRGWLKRGDVRLTTDPYEPLQVSQIIETARTLAGAPYLWGGTTPDSPDCSGFIYRLFRPYGIYLARNADDQAQMGEQIPFDQRQAGDLIFYSDVAGGPVTHVGLYMGNDQLMDANPWLGLSLHPLADMQNWYVFHSVRRVVP